MAKKALPEWDWFTYQPARKNALNADMMVFRKDASMKQIVEGTRLLADERHLDSSLALRMIELSSLLATCNFAINLTTFNPDPALKAADATPSLEVEFRLYTADTFHSWQLMSSLDGDHIIERHKKIKAPLLANERCLVSWKPQSAQKSVIHFWSNKIRGLMPIIEAARKASGN